MNKQKELDKGAVEYLERERSFNNDLRNLQSAPVEMVDDFQKPLIKDLPANKIDTNQVQKLTSGADFKAKQIIREAEREAKRQALGKVSGDTLDYSQFLKKGGKKLAAAVPLLGAGYAALQGDPAMAAEELVSDAVPVYDAIRPEIAGNPEEERMMLAERQAMQNYQNSPAKLAKMNALKGIK